ncbi:MAG TPA: MltA domain-containing protein [Alphaproteobacteria bacterium]|nr:MltA domain-containing protein [Alphaproteobacteria bacterium]
MKFPLAAALLAAIALPAVAQSPTITPVNPKTAHLWAKPPFGADGASLRTALSNSCNVFAKKSATQNVSTDPRFGTYGQWQSFCKEALLQSDSTLETYMTDTLEAVTLAPTGKFTGYYKPVVEGSLTHHGDYQTPMLAKPADLVVCNGASGQKLPGGGCKNPYPDRAEITRNIDKYKVLLWLKDPIDAYFIHIQGSALVELENGGTAYLNFAAKNGRPYVAIGKVLKDMGELKGDITADKIREWLAMNPTRMNEILHKNPSFIFFHKSDANPPGTARGALGVPLTAGRSLAVDRDFIPLGLPVVIATTTNHDNKPWQRVMLAQDIGSAITGGARGDIFFGLGPFAGDYAGDQNSGGTLQVLVPKNIGLAANATSSTINVSSVSGTAISATAVNEPLPVIAISESVVSMNEPVSQTLTPQPEAQQLAALETIEPAAAPQTLTEAEPAPADTVAAVKNLVAELPAAVQQLGAYIKAPNPTDTGL